MNGSSRGKNDLFGGNPVSNGGKSILELGNFTTGLSNPVLNGGKMTYYEAKITYSEKHPKGRTF
jgi:hypothetical protein